MDTILPSEGSGTGSIPVEGTTMKLNDFFKARRGDARSASH